MKKILTYILIVAVLLGSVAIPTEVNAASSKISMSFNKSSLKVGETVTVTVSASGGAESIDMYVNYDSDHFTFVGGSDVVDIGGAVQACVYGTNSFSFTLKAKKAGSTSLSTNTKYINNGDLEMLTPVETSRSITISNSSSGGSSSGGSSGGSSSSGSGTTSESSNNYLTGINTSCGVLSPAFNRDTFEYLLYITENDKECTITATAEDSGAEVAVTGGSTIEGTESRTINVTAEDGNVRKYTITYKLLGESDIVIDNTIYNVKADIDMSLIPSGFTPDKAEYKNQEVTVYKSSDGKITLIVLGDLELNINIYIYNEDDETMTPATFVTHEDKKYLIMQENVQVVYAQSEDGEYYIFNPETNTMEPIGAPQDSEESIPLLIYIGIGTLALLLITVAVLQVIIIKGKKSERYRYYD